MAIWPVTAATSHAYTSPRGGGATHALEATPRSSASASVRTSSSAQRMRSRSFDVGGNPPRIARKCSRVDQRGKIRDTPLLPFAAALTSSSAGSEL